MLRVFLADISGIALCQDTSEFSEYRLAKLKKLHSEQKIRQSIGAELLLIYALKQIVSDVVLPHEILCDDNMKPYFENSTLHFSLSHSGDYAACALSDKAVGIDIEHELKYNEKLAGRFFSEAEQAFLNASCDKDRVFARIWTAKESALKFWGIGLQKKLSDIDTQCSADYSIFYNETESVTISVCTDKPYDYINIEKIIL